MLAARAAPHRERGDPWTAISPLTAGVGGPEEIDVPAGWFRVLRVAYRIQKQGRGVEAYEIRVTDPPPGASSARISRWRDHTARYEIAFSVDKGRKEATFATDGTFLEEEYPG